MFQDGAVGESPSGGKLSTYKELCSLANEMGQPDLIYKFMDLANYQASLNTKRGAAFGFSKIAKQAGDALQPHLRLLIPRLIRYQYDPDKNVQVSMFQRCCGLLIALVLLIVSEVSRVIRAFDKNFHMPSLKFLVTYMNYIYIYVYICWYLCVYRFVDSHFL